MKRTPDGRPTPIPTRYNGYSFRSRLEARWAVFFDSLKIRWEYEPEGFDMKGGVRYLPDFKLYISNITDDRLGEGNSQVGVEYIWAEVKPDITSITQQDWVKLNLFSEYNHILVLDGVPDMQLYRMVEDIYDESSSCNIRPCCIRKDRDGYVFWTPTMIIYDDGQSPHFKSQYTRDYLIATGLAKSTRFY